MKKLLLLIVFIPFTWVHAQIIKVDLETKFLNSELIVQGQIIKKEAYKTNNSIYTNYTLKVSNVLKGNCDTNQLTINSIGGKVDNQMLDILI